MFKFPGRQFDPSDIIKNFTTVVKIKVFSKEDDMFDDMFQQKNTLKEVLHSAQMRFPPAEFQELKMYRERRIANIPLDKLRLEPVREPTPSISLSGSSGTSRSKSKFGRETSERSKRSKSDHNKSEGSVRDTAQSKEHPEQQVITSPQVNLSPLIIHPPPVRTELDKEWEKFNDLINTEVQSTKTPESNVQTVDDIVTGTINNVSEMEHIPITPSSELILKIEEIPPLDVFYSL